MQLLLQKGERVRGMISLETIGWFSDKPGSQKYPAPFNLIYPDLGNFVAFVGMPGSRNWLHEVIGPFRVTRPCRASVESRHRSSRASPGRITCRFRARASRR